MNFLVRRCIQFSKPLSNPKLFSSTVNITVSVANHPYTIGNEILGESKKDIFAVFEFSGTQYKVTLDDVIVADKMDGVDIGDTIDITNVCLVGTKSNTYIGRPHVPGAKVIATVEEITRDKKVIAFKLRRRKNSKRTKGFRRQVCILRISDIVQQMPGEK